MSDILGSKPLKESDDELSKYLLDRLRQLEERNLRLSEEYRKVEAEKRYTENQKIKFEREIRKLRSELERLKSPPQVVGTVINVLDNERLLIKSSTGPKFVVTASQFINEKKFIPGTQVALNQQSLAVVAVLPSTKDSQVYGMEIIEDPGINYEGIGGLKDQIREVKEIVELPLLHPEKFEAVGIEPPKGVLFYGPPGTGKTLLAKAVAQKTDSTFMRVVGSELVQKYIGEGARLVREVFELAKEKVPSILFIDELDAIGAKRLENSTSGDREVQRTLMQLLAEMDGFNQRGDVKIIGATNRPDILDPALLRPGRFDRMIEIPMPDLQSRVEIFKIHTKKMNLEDNIDFLELSGMLEAASGADIHAIAMESGMFAIREERSIVGIEDFRKAIHKVMNKGIDQKKSDHENKGVMFA